MHEPQPPIRRQSAARAGGLLIERGQCDRDLAELGVDPTDKREDIAAGIRQIAEAIESTEA